MNSVSVIIEHSKLKREVYDFYLENEYYLWLEGYALELRETPRHKFRAKEQYRRLDERNSTLKENQVILFPEIIKMAKDNLIKQIKVQKWSERK